MPPWVKNLTSAGQIAIVGMSIGAVVLLALQRIIDGAAALTALLVITGAGSAIHAATTQVVNKAIENGNDAPKESQRGGL